MVGRINQLKEIGYMPLEKSSTNAARSRNIAEMIRSGHKPSQAKAAAYSQQRKSKRKQRKHTRK